MLRREQDRVRAPERGFITNMGTQETSQGMRCLSFLEGCPEFLKNQRIIGVPKPRYTGREVWRHLQKEEG